MEAEDFKKEMSDDSYEFKRCEKYLAKIKM